MYVVIPYLPAHQALGGVLHVPNIQFEYSYLESTEIIKKIVGLRTYGTIICCQIRLQQRAISRSTQKRAEDIKNSDSTYLR